MNTPASNTLNLLGRLGLAALFLPAGIGKITGFSGTVGYIASVGLPMATLGAILALVVEVAGGLALILGYKTRIAALALAVFTLVASFFFHAFWSMAPEQAGMQQLMFWKNIAISGGLLVLAAHGAGAFSLDGRHRA